MMRLGLNVSKTENVASLRGEVVDAEESGCPDGCLKVGTAPKGRPAASGSPGFSALRSARRVKVSVHLLHANC